MTKVAIEQGLLRTLQGTSLAGWPLSTHGNTVGEEDIGMSRNWNLYELITQVKEFFFHLEDK